MKDSQIFSKVDLEMKLKLIEERFDKIIENAIRIGKVDDELLDLRRRLSVFSMFYEDNIISVTGLQSTGKSTLVKNIFELEDDVLPIEVGVGEKRPLLIRGHHNIKKGEERYFEVCLELVNNRYDKETKPLENKSHLKEKLLNPDNNLLYLELWIPYNEILGEKTLALLPGLERSKRSISQKFVDIYIENSIGLISTIRKDSLANKNQEKLLDKIYEVYSDKPFSFVITFSSEVSEDERLNLINELKEKYDINNENQIIFTDTNEDLIKVQQNFKNLIYNTLNDSNTLLNRQTESISNIITDIEYKLQELSEEIKLEAEFDGIKPRDKKLIRTFRTNKVDYLNSVEETLNIKLDNYINTIMKDVRKNIVQEKNGVISKLASVFKKDLNYNQKFEIKKQAEKLFSSYVIDDHLSTPETLMIETVNDINQKKLGNIFNDYMRKNNDIDLEINNLEALEVSDENQTDNEIIVIEENKNNKFNEGINQLIQNNLVSVANYLQPQNEVVLKADDLKTIPYLIGAIVQYQGSLNLKFHGTQSDDMLFKVFNDKKLMESELNEDKQDILLSTKNILVGSSVFLGLDASDGKVNSLDALKTAALGMGIPASGLLPITVGIAALGTAAISISVGSKNIEGYKHQKDYIIDSILLNAKEHYIKNTLNTLNQIFDNLEEKILFKMNSIANTSGKLDAVINLDNDLDILLNKIKELKVEVYKIEGPRI
ncbi:hypothetical protein ETI06_00230 [Macrococcoides goetzii]|nr:hypothetical protein [Macrococcus goetzii]TDM50437.1 hypothetical protein ETI06_00230 [Macrococcus goetzii]